jgi:acyl dehydratase
MDIKKPVFTGDTLEAEIDVIDQREIQKPDRGIVAFYHPVSNQKREGVMEYWVKRMIRCRDDRKRD